MDNQNFNQSTPNQPLPESSQMPPIMPEPKPNKKVWVVSGILGAVVIIALVIYFVLPKLGQDIIKKTTEDIYKPAVAFASKFATYEEVAVNINLKVPAYTVSPDLSNIINAKDLYYYDFSPSSFSD